MKHLKITQKGWAGYSSAIGGVPFKDGISEHPVPRYIADRISSGISMVEINEDGSETPAGVAHRLVSEARERAPVAKPLERATEEELKDEAALDAIRASKAPVDTFYTGEELEAIVDAKGIKGLREIADRWEVRHRSIPTLIGLVLKAQTKHLEERNLRLQKIADRQDEAVKEAAIADLAKREEEAAAQAEADRIASTLLGSSILASSYTAGEVTLSLGDIVAEAHKRTGLTVTGWNKLDDAKRESLLSEQMEIFAAHYGCDLVAVAQTPADEPKEDEKAQDQNEEPASLGAGIDALKVGGAEPGQEAPASEDDKNEA
jgi:hypothetical protein